MCRLGLQFGAVGVIFARPDYLSAASHEIFGHAVPTCSQLGEEHEISVHPVEWVVVYGCIVLESGSFLPMNPMLIVFRVGCGDVRMRCTGQFWAISED
jgi:hypothetical protein